MIVVKFGGSSVSNVSRMRRIAHMVVDRYILKKEQVVIVVSAMEGVTDRLTDYLSEFNQEKTLEYDVVLAAGEPISTALLAITFTELGYRSRSFLGWQLPIITNDTISNARIIDISVGHLYNCCDDGVIPIVAGFQGMTEDSRITTLGRGGSDATAVALAAVLQAERCDIYTDVDGVYTADPKIVSQARKLQHISYEEMFEMSFRGAKVLQTRSVELAMKYHVPVRVLSSFIEGSGTNIVEKTNMEQFAITGITSKQNIVKIEITLTHHLNTISECVKEINSLSQSMEWFSQIENSDSTVISFLCVKDEVDSVIELCNRLKKRERIHDFSVDYDVAELSMIGIGIGTRANIIQTVIDTFASNQMPILSIHTSSLSVSVLTTKPNITLALCALHTAFDLANVSAHD